MYGSALFFTESILDENDWSVLRYGMIWNVLSIINFNFFKIIMFEMIEFLCIGFENDSLLVFTWVLGLVSHSSRLAHNLRGAAEAGLTFVSDTNTN